MHSYKEIKLNITQTTFQHYVCCKRAGLTLDGVEGIMPSLVKQIYKFYIQKNTRELTRSIWIPHSNFK